MVPTQQGHKEINTPAEYPGFECNLHTRELHINEFNDVGAIIVLNLVWYWITTDWYVILPEDSTLVASPGFCEWTHWGHSGGTG